MNTNKKLSDLPEITRAWSAFQKHSGLGPIRTQEDFERIQELADALAITVGDDEDHPLSSLFELTMTLIAQWEDEHEPIPAAPPREVLRYLLEEHELKQKDLEDIASPALISDILAGRREISKRLAKALADRFHSMLEHSSNPQSLFAQGARPGSPPTRCITNTGNSIKIEPMPGFCGYNRAIFQSKIPSESGPGNHEHHIDYFCRSVLAGHARSGRVGRHADQEYQ